MKKTNLATLIAVGFTASGVALSAGAQESGRDLRSEPRAAEAPRGGDRTNQVSFEKADKNKDGVVNREEGNQINGFDFSRADTNNDRSLTRQEFEAAMATSTPRGDGVEPAQDRTAQTTFEKADRNSDGKISREEANEIPGFNFSKADVDDNASLSRQEFQTAMADSTPRG